MQIDSQLIVAGLTARMMAESAFAGGFNVVALDLFGDADTRLAAASWEGIGDPSALSLSPDALLATLRRLRQPQRARMLGWVAGTGFEDQPDLLEAGARILPLLGNSAHIVRLVKDPQRFFPLLHTLGIPHSETRIVRPDDPDGWLCKRIGGSGAWHIRPAGEAHTGAQVYYQRVTPGMPMSVSFLAHAEGVHLLGVHRQSIGRRRNVPYVFEGLSGPVTLSTDLLQDLMEAVQALADACGLVGLNSLDFLCDGTDFQVLELNPRPSAAIALYDDAYADGLMHAHVLACRGMVPAPPQRNPTRVRGFRTVWAERDLDIDASLTDALMNTGWCHDVPFAGKQIQAGAPLCTVSARARSVDAVDEMLRDRIEQLHDFLKALHVDPHTALHDALHTSTT